MNENAQRYPLAWPMNWKRTLPRERRRADFRRTITKQEPVRRAAGTVAMVERKSTDALTIAAAIDRLEGELRRLGAEKEILSTNVALGLRGMPLSVTKEPGGPGVAVYIVLHRKELVFACCTRPRS